ncbi:mavicyanin-like [Cynara cardunculus var. scolymus]|nr:mavicyanin-like [Cynara cardunculus var. scolymus]
MFLSMILGGSEAREFLVGGNENSWRVSTSPNHLIQWAEKERFKIGDSLVFKYDSKVDSVLKVDEEDYKKCNKNKPLKEYHDGNTTIVLDKAGPFFFISGFTGHCDKGVKLEVKVLSHKHGSIGESSPSIAPKPSPKESSPKISSPSVSTPPESPKKSDAGLNFRVDIYTVAMASMVAITMV